MDYLCVSDHGMMGVIPRQIRACEGDQDKQEKKIRPIFACELYLQDKHPSKDVFSQMTSEEKKAIRKSYHLLAIAYNNVGYSNLVKLSSWAWMHGFYYRPRVTHEQLRKHKEGIIFTSCCYNSEIGQAFDKGGEEAAYAMVEKYLEQFGENFYLELMLLDFNKQKPYDAFIVKAHDKYHIPLILTNDCFVRDTIVSTSDGSKFIQDVKVGDLVLTHKGNYKNVQYVNCRDLSEEEKVFRVKTSLGTYAFDATGNHPMLVAEVGNVKWNVKRKEIKSKSWKNVDQLSVGDYLVIPKIKQDLVFAKDDLTEIDTYKYVFNFGDQRGRMKYDDEKKCFLSSRGFGTSNFVEVPRYLKVDEDLLKMIGLYLAEGGLDKQGSVVTFGIHVDELDERDLIFRFFSKFNISVSEKVTGNGRKLWFSSVFFRDFFENFCGCGANNKSFKNIILKFSKTQVISILGQYFKGDGHFPSDYDRVSNITSTSKKMIFDVSFILNSLGLLVMPCVNFHENAKHKNPNANIANWYDGYYLSSGSYSKAKLKNILYGETLNEKKSNKGKRYVEGEDCYAVKIKKISEVSYIDKVYNLQVADDETYCANLYSCHNCHYCNQEDSKYQRYMLMIQKETSIKEIEKKLSTEDRMDIFELQDQNLWMKSERELNEKWLEMYQDVIPYDLFIQAKRNTVEICRKANGVEIDRSLKLPQFPDANDRLKDAIIQGVKWRGCNGRKYLDRIKEEYELICRKGFASYFLIQKQMTDEARRICPELLGWGDGSEAVGPGRGCLSGDVEIIVDKGISKRLDNVKVGDRVITHTGEFKTVLEVLNYSVEEKLVKLYSFYGDNGGVTLTKDHLVLSEQCHKTNETKKWAESTKSSKCKIIEPTGNLEWVRADSLKVGDWIFVPFPETKINNVDCIDLADFCNSKELHNDENYVYQDWMNPLTGSIRKRKKLKRIITLDEEWHTVIGLFAGDGWLRSDESGRVGFCFHSEDNLDSLNLLEKKLSEIEAEYYLKKESDKKLIQVVVNNRFFYLMFKKLYDRYKCTPETKHVPDFVFTQKDEYRWAYLRGYLFSDGHHKYKHKLSFTTCSAELASQTRMVCWSLGVPCSLGRYDRIDKRSNKRSVGFTLVAPHKNQLSGMDAQKIYQYRKIDDGFLFRIRKIEESDDVNVVYDLTVEDNHNYLTTSFLVHNSAVGSLVCYCLGITDVDPIRHNLLFSRFLSESRGGKSIRLKFSSKKVSA